MGIVYKLSGRVVTEEEFRQASKPGRLQEMLEAGVPPCANTDREFLQGHCNGSQFQGQEERGEAYRAVAEAAGQEIKGKVYLSSLARFPGDPQAWVSGKGDAERLLDVRGWGSEGAITRPVRQVAEAARVGVDPDIVQNTVLEVEEAERAAGAEEQVDRIDLAEQVYNTRRGIYGEPFQPEIHCPHFVAEQNKEECP